jgi:hypothetical protein
VDGRVTGRAMARPVGIGLVFEPSAEVLQLAVEQATLLWGGQYQPFFRPGDLDRIERVSRRLEVDVLLALDLAGASEDAAALDGYQWQGREGWGPLAPAQDYISHRLLGPERLLDELPRDSWVLPDWAADDPLDDLFRVWFGAYGTSAQGVSLEKQFAARATRVRIDDGAEVPAEAASWITPVTSTSGAIDYRGMSPGAAFVVVDPSDPASLTALWNARACGARAFPFPAGHEERVLPAAESWLQQLLEEGELSRWVTGDGTPAGPRIYIWQATGPGELPGTLADLLIGHDVTPVPVSPDLGQEWARGWQGDHPFTTSYAHSFAQPLEADGRVARIPVPGIGGAQDSGVPRGDIIAVQVEISAASGVRPDWTFSVPNKRSYAPVLREYDGLMLSFDRPYRESMIPHVLGWAVKGPGLECEVDIAAVLDDRGLPALIVSEVKSWQDSIEVNDLNNLRRIQQHIRGQGVECFVLATVMRELREDETSALRDFAQRPPRTLPEDSAIEPVLPIVLTEQNLSATRFDQHCPSTWSPADGIVGLAKESCQRNLGMTGLEPAEDDEGFYFRPQWQPPSSAAAPNRR